MGGLSDERQHRATEKPSRDRARCEIRTAPRALTIGDRPQPSSSPRENSMTAESSTAASASERASSGRFAAITRAPAASNAACRSMRITISSSTRRTEQPSSFRLSRHCLSAATAFLAKARFRSRLRHANKLTFNLHHPDPQLGDGLGKGSSKRGRVVVAGALLER